MLFAYAFKALSYILIILLRVKCIPDSCKDLSENKILTCFIRLVIQCSLDIPHIDISGFSLCSDHPVFPENHVKTGSKVGSHTCNVKTIASFISEKLDITFWKHYPDSCSVRPY